VQVIINNASHFLKKKHQKLMSRFQINSTAEAEEPNEHWETEVSGLINSTKLILYEINQIFIQHKHYNLYLHKIT